MKKKILLISPVPTHPQSAGHRTRIFHLAGNLKKLGHSVYFVYLKGRFQTREDDMPAMKKYWGKRLFLFPYRNFQPRRNKKGLPAGQWNPDRWLDKKLESGLKKLADKIKPGIVIVEYAAISKALECFKGKTLKIIDTLDIYAGRDRRLLAHGIPLSGWYSLSAAQEKAALKRANALIAIQKDDGKHFIKTSGTKVTVVGHHFPIHTPVFKKVPGTKILFVGAGSQVSKKSAEYFIQKMFPLILKKIPSAKFYTAGKVCSLLKNHPRCVKLGYVKNLDEIYTDADMVVNSEVFATGLSTKNMMALAHSKPLVTTPSGARGMTDGARKAFLVADKPEAFATAVIKALTDPAIARRLSRQAFRYARRKNRESFRALAGLVR